LGTVPKEGVTGVLSAVLWMHLMPDFTATVYSGTRPNLNPWSEGLSKMVEGKAGEPVARGKISMVRGIQTYRIFFCPTSVCVL
jgi:hypothetical protein